MKLILSFFISLLLVISVAQAAEQVFVSSKKVKLYTGANYSSEAVTELKKGDELNVLSQKGNWMEVQHAAVKGWVPGYSVSKTKPKEKVSFFNRLKSFFTSDSKRARTSTISTAGGVRGLAEDGEAASGKKDFEAVEKMEQLQVKDEEIEKFVEENAR